MSERREGGEMKIKTTQYDCGCKSHIITYPSGLKRFYWEYDHECKIHKITEGREEK